MEQIRKELEERSLKNRLEFIECDLSDLRSVAEFARKFREGHDRLDVLMNNAGVYNMR